MGFYDIYKKYQDLTLKAFSENEVEKAIQRDSTDPFDLLAMLSPASEAYIEEMAQKAHRLTLRNFGKTIQLYTPLYLSNYCDNSCAYCGFKHDNRLKRRTLTVEEAMKEAGLISETGLKHILLLTGGSKKEASLSYIKENVRALKKEFTSIAVEIYALSFEEYKDLIDEGVDGLTIYQEVYDEEIYAEMHETGPKSDHMFRLDAPERALEAGMRCVNIGALLGLNDWRSEAFFVGLHAKYLQDKFPESEISISVPRIRPQVSGFEANCRVTDRDIVHIITAMRIFLPRVGITVSTRENAELRDNLLPLGVTRMSAGSTTAVGGRTLDDAGESQFAISDERDVESVKTMLRSKGYQPVLQDWL